MRVSSCLSLLLFLGVAGCTSTTAPPQVALDGIWVTGPIPSGGGRSLDLRSSGTNITGSGTDYGLEHVVIGTYTITGTCEGVTVDLTMSYDDGSTATFVGHTVGTDTMQGTWSGHDGGQVALFRSYPPRLAASRSSVRTP